MSGPTVNSPPSAGSSIGTVSGETAHVLVTPSASDENGVVVKAPSAAWGAASVPYGKGQAFMLLKEGAAGATLPDDLVMFRVDPSGAIGSCGGIHSAPGLRARAGFVPAYGLRIQPSIDCPGIIIDSVASPASDFLLVRENGTGNPFLRVDSSGRVTFNTPQARARRTTNLSLSNGLPALIAFDAEDYDTDAIHDLVTNTTRLTCRTAGVYDIKAGVRFAANATGYRQVYIQRNSSSANTIGAELRNASAVGPTDLNVSTSYKLAVGDYIEVVATQDSGGALDLSAAGPQAPVFSMTYTGRG